MSLVASAASPASSSILETVAVSPWTGYVLTLVFGALSVVLYYAGKRVKIPVYRTHGANLIRDLASTVEGLTIRFPGYGQPIKNLTVTRVVFWNRGKTAIRRTDVSKKDLVRIKCKPGVVILQASILATSSPTNNFMESVNIDKNCVNLDFDFIDYNQGVVVQIFHTGVSDMDLELAGTIIEAKAVERIRYPGKDGHRFDIRFYRGCSFYGLVLLALYPGHVDQCAVGSNRQCHYHGDAHTGDHDTSWYVDDHSANSQEKAAKRPKSLR